MMQILCCYRGRRAPSDRSLSTPVAPPARTVLSNPQGQAVNHPTISLPNAKVPSLMTIPRHQAVLDPTILDVEESDSEGELDNQSGSPTSTLGAFKSKLIRRLSDKSHSKQQLQQSSSSSRNEALARRVELKRLRHKRIKEELESEEETETKSNELDPIRCTARSTSDPPDNSGQGPRDNIEFSVCEADDANSDRSYTPAPEMVALALPIVVASTSLRDHSTSPTTAIHSCKCPDLQAENTIRDRESLPDMPAPPQLEPVRLSSDAGASSSIASWNLSYSAGQLANYIGDLEIDASGQEEAIVKLPAQESTQRPKVPERESGSSLNMDTEQPGMSTKDLSVDRENTSTPTSIIGTDHGSKSFLIDSYIDEVQLERCRGILHSTTTSDQSSPLDLWLRASGMLQSISRSSTRRNSDSILESRPTISTIGDLSSSINPHRIKPSSPSHPCLKSSLLKIPGSFSENVLPRKKSTLNFQASHSSKPYDIVSLDVNNASNVQALSSRYKFRSVSVDHVRPASMLSFSKEKKKPRGFRQDTFNKEFSELQDMIDANKSEASSYKTAPIQSSTADVIISGKENVLHTSNGSTTVSETTSFKQREAELESVAKRFAVSSGWHPFRSPMVSRFREEFDHSSSQPSGKFSLLARFLPSKEKPRKTLQKEKPPSHIGHRNCLKEAITASHLITGGPYTSVTNIRGQHFLSEEGNLGLEETATDLWQRAVRLEAERREARHLYQAKPWHSRQSSKVDAYQSNNASSGGVEPGSSHVRDASSVYSHSHYGNRADFQLPTSRPITGHAEARISRASSEASSHINNETQHQIEYEGHPVSRAPSLGTHIHAGHKYNVIPQSWAKWSSHDRTERNGATGTDDSVIPKDFAMTSTILGSDKERHITIPVVDYTVSSRRSVSAKLSRALRDSFAKFIPGQERTYSQVSNHRNRPGSTGYLEYPELELLPQHGGHKELDAIAKTIDQIKRTSVALDTRPRCLSGASSRTPLSLRFAQEVHKFQHGERSGSPHAGYFLSATAPKGPNTPVGKQTAARTISAASQQYGTPMTHISYEDCIPKHMLDENGSTKSDTTIMIKRSKSAVEHNMTSLPHKYSTWNGRTKSASLEISKTQL